MLKKYFTTFYIIIILFSGFLILMSSYFKLFLGDNFVYLFFVILLPLIEKGGESISKEIYWGDIKQTKKVFFASVLLIILTLIFNWYEVSYIYSTPCVVFFGSWLLRIDEKFLFSLGLISLIFTVCFLLMKNQENANISAISLYMFLVYGTVLAIINSKSLPDEIN